MTPSLVALVTVAIGVWGFIGARTMIHDHLQRHDLTVSDAITWGVVGACLGPMALIICGFDGWGFGKRILAKRRQPKQ